MKGGFTKGGLIVSYRTFPAVNLRYQPGLLTGCRMLRSIYMSISHDDAGSIEKFGLGEDLLWFYCFRQFPGIAYSPSGA